MAEEKKNDPDRKTKAGMMSKNESRKNKKPTLEKDPENTPKISKDKAEGDHDDRPIH